jgi:hypothetical protein
MAARNPREPMLSPGPCDGRLSPWADPGADAPGWRVTTRSRTLAAAIAAAFGATVQSCGKGWQARMPLAVLMVVVIDADADALWCRLSARADSGVLALVFAPWSAGTVLQCPRTALPAHGRLSVREVQVITRMGRTVRYLAPEFSTP